jgi:hypothetical protein
MGIGFRGARGLSDGSGGGGSGLGLGLEVGFLAAGGELLEFLPLGGTGRIVLGEDAFQEPGGGTPAAAAPGPGGGENLFELIGAEFFAGAEKGEADFLVIALPAGKGRSADVSETGGGAIGDAALDDDGAEDFEDLRGKGRGATGRGIHEGGDFGGDHRCSFEHTVDTKKWAVKGRKTGKWESQSVGRRRPTAANAAWNAVGQQRALPSRTPARSTQIIHGIGPGPAEMAERFGSGM